VHQQGAGCEVESTTLSGDTVAVMTLDASEGIKPALPRRPAQDEGVAAIDPDGIDVMRKTAKIVSASKIGSDTTSRAD